MKTKKHKCRRCGKCCENVGTLWLQSKHPIIQRIYSAMHPLGCRDNQPCDMLYFTKKGKAICLLEKYLGKKAKPEICQKYPFDDESLKQCEERREWQT